MRLHSTQSRGARSGPTTRPRLPKQGRGTFYSPLLGVGVVSMWEQVELSGGPLWGAVLYDIDHESGSHRPEVALLGPVSP